MKTSCILTAVLCASLAHAQSPDAPIALTIYNQDFAVARTTVDLELHKGMNEVTTTQVTSELEPDSVVLRDPSGQHIVQVVEQNYDAGVVNQAWMLNKYEGKTVDFQTSDGHILSGRIIRAGKEPEQIGYNGGMTQQEQPLIEVKGQMQFQLPGLPLFPASVDGLLLKPTLRWKVYSAKSEHYPAEFAYITGGFSWQATYNVVAPDTNDVSGQEKAEVIGWVTLHNQSGSDFPAAKVKLMAGDVAKVVLTGQYGAIGAFGMGSQSVSVNGAPPPAVTQKAFDDFHIYDLNRTVELHNSETKQVQFLDALAVPMKRSYSYDGAATELQPTYQPYFNGNVNMQRGYGLDSGNTKVQILEEIKNSGANHLGIPLPAGRVRLYRKDGDGQMEFVGESVIDHTPVEDSVKISTGSAFDIKGSRQQTDFHTNQDGHSMDESFEIKLTNQKLQSVEVVVVEHMYRANNWEITQKSTAGYTKRDSHTIEFPLEVVSKGASSLTYTIHYTW